MVLSTVTPAYQGIAHIDPMWLQEALRAAPAYNERVASAISRTIRCIHGLEDLHQTAFRDQLEVYLGRATESTLAQRWKTHSATKHHRFGAVVFTCDPDRAEVLEDIAVRALKKLKDRESLCVGAANVWPGSAGRPPRRGESAIIYMTWRIAEDVDWSKPTTGEIREIAREVAGETPHAVASAQVERGLGTLKRLSEADRLRWWLA